jgi:DNA helicase-2/ATP-dependent DNA helicase PcrA
MVIMDQANQCHSLARSLSGKYQSMEEMDSRDLKEYTNRLGQAKNYERISVAIDFAIECMTETTALKRIREAFKANKKLKPELLAVLRLLADSTSFNQVVTTLDALAVYSGGNIFRKELWTEMKRLLTFADQNDISLEESMYIVRNKSRVIGRYMHPRMISRTLLVKGLEFDHVVISSADKMSKENLYVALTRPTHTLTILSGSPTLQPR